MYRKQGGTDGPPPPEEHPGVPGGTRLAFEKVLGARGLRLLLERGERVGHDPVDLDAVRQPRQQVAVLRRRAGDLGAERHERIVDPERPGGQPLRRDADDVGVDALTGRVDVRVRGDDEHDVVVGPIDGRRRQGDRGGRVATHRLEQEAGVRELVADDALESAVGHDRDVVGQPAQPSRGRLDEGLVAQEWQERLGVLGAAQGVEPRPATAGHDHGVHAGPS